jgi:polar amino acid transport system substrate-binding protein
MKSTTDMGRLLVMAALLVGMPASAATITIAADEWCPYNCEPSSDKPGYMIEIAQKVFGEAGHTIEYQSMPWSRAIEEARRGRFSAIVGATARDAPDFDYPSRSLGVGVNVFLTAKGSDWRFSDIGSLATVSLGTIRDYSYGDALDAYIAQHGRDAARVQVASGDTALDINFKKLAAGRIGALVEDRNVAEYYLANSSQQGGFDTVGDLGENPLYIAFSPAIENGAEYARLLAEGVQKMRASGELATLLTKYGLQDWE